MDHRSLVTDVIKKKREEEDLRNDDIERRAADRTVD
jgi:hypothetical protein